MTTVHKEKANRVDVRIDRPDEVRRVRGERTGTDACSERKGCRTATRFFKCQRGGDCSRAVRYSHRIQAEIATQ